jgi:phosphoglycerate dehydrogenase-like enzyme
MLRRLAPAEFELVTLDEDTDVQRKARIADCEAVVMARPLARDVLDAAVRLRVVQHQGVGYQDMVDMGALRARGLPLALMPEGTTIPVAEHVVMLIIAVHRKLAFADSELRRGRWHVNALRPTSRSLFGQTVGIVGMGRIGQAVADRLDGFGVRVIFADPFQDSLKTVKQNRRCVDLVTLLTESDVVTLHLPLTEATRCLIDRRELARMKPGAIIVNTARGGLINEAALCEALNAGRLAGAGLDVFEQEPQPADTPLSRFNNVVLTPHIAAGTRDALEQKFTAIFENLQRFFRGETLRYAVDPDGT